jgi:hypothetical protein
MKTTVTAADSTAQPCERVNGGQRCNPVKCALCQFFESELKRLEGIHVLKLDAITKTRGSGDDALKIEEKNAALRAAVARLELSNHKRNEHKVLGAAKSGGAIVGGPGRSH